MDSDQDITDLGNGSVRDAETGSRARRVEDLASRVAEEGIVSGFAGGSGYPLTCPFIGLLKTSKYSTG